MKDWWESSLYTAFSQFFCAECTTCRQRSVSAHRPSLETLEQAETLWWCSAPASPECPCAVLHPGQGTVPTAEESPVPVHKGSVTGSTKQSGLSSKSTLYLQNNFGAQGQSFYVSQWMHCLNLDIICLKLVGPTRNLVSVSVFSLSLVTHNGNPNILRLGKSGTQI